MENGQKDSSIGLGKVIEPISKSDQAENEEQEGNRFICAVTERKPVISQATWGCEPSSGQKQTVCLDFQNWASEGALAKMMLGPCDLMLHLDRFTSSKLLENGSLRVCLRIPEDFPGGLEQFVTILELFLTGKNPFGIEHVCVGDKVIDQFLAGCRQRLKKHRSTSEQGKRQGNRGKNFKWRSPVVRFGCKVKWAHDLLDPSRVYVRVRSLETDSSALVLVNAANVAFRNDLGGDLHQFITLITPQLHLQIVVFWWKRNFRQMSSQCVGPGDPNHPSQDGLHAEGSVRSPHADASTSSATQLGVSKANGSTLEDYLITDDDADSSGNEDQLGKRKKKGKYNRKKTRYKKSKRKSSDAEDDAEQLPSSARGSTLNPLAQPFEPAAQEVQVLPTGSVYSTFVGQGSESSAQTAQSFQTGHIFTPSHASDATSGAHFMTPVSFSQHAMMAYGNQTSQPNQAQPISFAGSNSDSNGEPTPMHPQYDLYGLAGPANTIDDGHLADDEAPRAVRPLPEPPSQPQPAPRKDQDGDFQSTQGAYHSFRRRRSRPLSISLRAPTTLSTIPEQKSDSSEEGRRKSRMGKGKEPAAAHGDGAVSTTEPEESQDTGGSITSEPSQSESPHVTMEAKNKEKSKRRLSRLTAAMLNSASSVSSSSSNAKHQADSNVTEPKTRDDPEGWCLVTGRKKGNRSSTILMSRGRPLARRSADETEWARLSTSILRSRGGQSSASTPRPPAMNETEYPPLPSQQRAVARTSGPVGNRGPTLQETVVQAARITEKVARQLKEASTSAPPPSSKRGHRRQPSIRAVESSKRSLDQADKTVTTQPTKQQKAEAKSKANETRDKATTTAAASDGGETAPAATAASSSSTDTWRPFIVSSVPTQTRAGSSTKLSNTATSSQAPTRTGATVDGPVHQDGRYWQLDTHVFPCARHGCTNKCLTWGATTVICPRCGPYSEIRYCNLAHLFEDVKEHWCYCGHYTFEHPCVSRLPREWEDGPPMLPCIHGWDSPERHRQALRFNIDRSGDYFIFHDWWDWVAARMPENDVRVRCSSRVVAVVQFEGEMRDRFRRCLALALFAGLEVYHIVQYIFRMIRDRLRARNEWTNNLDSALRYQLRLETGVQIRATDVGRRHACETEWFGAHRLGCTDRVCRDEYTTIPARMRTLHASYGIERLMSYSEANFWILRAARISHPDVHDVNERIRGKGFPGVRPEHCRLFARGAGWDGAGTGEMELEPM